MSIVTKGHQMIPILNRLGVQAAVYGNHDFGEWLVLLVYCLTSL